MKPKIVIVLGPTAVSKSDIAMELALQMSGEIINADSQQVYRQMNIGTAKPSKRECERIPHHLIDIVDPDEEFNVARYRELAAAGVHDIQKKGKPEIACGGTGLYMKALTRGLLVGPTQDAEIRAAHTIGASGNVLRTIYERLR